MSGFDLGFIRLQDHGQEPLFEQLADALRNAILGGHLVRGFRLPSTRDLARQLALSRTTVVTAFDQLVAEGYLQGRVGRGTFVSDQLPEEQQIVRFQSPGLQVPKTSSPSRSQRGYLSGSAEAWLERGDTTPLDHYRPCPFRPGIPALDQFPVELWSRLYRQRWNRLSETNLSYGTPAGYEPLRRSLASYVSLHRGVRCSPEQVVVVHGTQQAVDIVCRLVIEPGDSVLFENPGYGNARRTYLAGGARIIPMDIDAQGARLSSVRMSDRRARLVHVTPSHQYPLGVTLSIERRMELIDWAEENRGLILEDDYDSEYRYANRPIPSLQGLDPYERTIYVGSFSKVLFPALSMGYVVVPRPLLDAFLQFRSLTSRPCALLDQIVLHEFMEQGHFDRHLRRMRGVHRARRDALVSAVEKHLPQKLEILGDEAGLHCAALLRTGEPDEDVSQRLSQNRIVAPPLSGYYMKGRKTQIRQNGLVLGFAAASPHQIRAAVRKMKTLL